MTIPLRLGLLEAITFVCVEQRPVLMVAYDLAVPAPLNEARPIASGFAVALVLAPPSDCSLASMHLRLDETHQDEATPPAMTLHWSEFDRTILLPDRCRC